jgi:hypothetical protein
MKPLLLLSVGMVLASASRADGPINLNNFIDGSLRSINFPTADGSARFYDGTGVEGAGWRAQFVTSDGTPIGGLIPFRTGTQAGRLDFRAPLESSQRTVPGNPGETLAITVRVWDTQLFASWADAETAFNRGPILWDSLGRPAAIGTSTFNYTVPGVDAPFGADRIVNFQGLHLITVVMPEPRTVALGVIGAAALLWPRLRPKRQGGGQ